jgi:glutamate racemase
MTGQPTADAPIGIFDSGVGGLAVARAILDQLPGEELRYGGDTAHSAVRPAADPDLLHIEVTGCD